MIREGMEGTWWRINEGESDARRKEGKVRKSAKGKAGGKVSESERKVVKVLKGERESKGDEHLIKGSH